MISKIISIFAIDIIMMQIKKRDYTIQEFNQQEEECL